MTTRILIVDDHPVTRKALRNAIEEAIEDAVIDLAGSLADAFALAPGPSAHDLVLLDLTLPDATGVATIGAWCHRHPASAVIAITDTEDAATAEGCLAAGATACAPKTRETRQIIGMIRDALDALPGAVPALPPPAAPTLQSGIAPGAIGWRASGGAQAGTTRHSAGDWTTERRHVTRGSATGWRTVTGVRYGHTAPGWDDGRQLNLTPRQREVLKLLMQGQPNKLICRELKLAEGTVKVHVSAVLRALNVTNRAQVVVAAARLGLRID